MTARDDRVDDAELARFGIRRVPSDSFVWGDYRYSNARDAIAAARRGAVK